MTFDAAVDEGREMPDASKGAGPGGLPVDHGSALYRKCALYVIAAAVLFAVVYAVLAWLRYRMFIYGGRFDLGNMTQVVYNTAHGHFLETTTADLGARQASRLGSHVDPIIAAFAVPWLIWPSPVMLITVQAGIVSTGAWPAFRLATRWLGDPRAGALLAGAFLLYPALGFLVLDEFHPVALATPLLLFAFLFIEEDRWWPAVPFLVAAALCKEEVPLVLATMGAYFALRKRSWRPLLLSLAALGYFAVALWVVIPHFTAGGTPFADRYAAFGDSAGEMVVTVLTRPQLALDGLVQLGNLAYWRDLLWPFVFTPLLSPLTLLIAAPEFVLNALSAKATQRSIELHYTAVQIPFLYAAAVLGLVRLRGWLKRFWVGISPIPLAVAVLVGCLAANILLGPLPFPLPGAAYDQQAYRKPAHAAALDGAVALVPRGATVSVANNVGAALSARRRVLTFPAYEGADYVVLDLYKPDVFDRYDPEGYEAALRSFSNDARYELVYERDGALVFRRLIESDVGGEGQ